MDYKSLYQQSLKENEGLCDKIKALKKENVELNKIEKVSNVKSDLINELFSKMVHTADINDGISISNKYGDKYGDKYLKGWNKIYEDIIKDTIDIINEYELYNNNVYLYFNNCSDIEFCVYYSSDEE